jgi:hypothetical protein
MKELNANDRRDASILGKFSPATRRVFESLLKSGVADRAIAEAEAQTLAERTRLIEQLAAAEKNAKHPQPRLEAAAVKAARALEDAQRTLKAAMDAHAQAQAALQANERAYRAERMRIVSELRASADPRLEEFVIRLGNIASSDLVLALQAWPDEQKREKGLLFAVASNVAQVEAARAAITAAIERTEAQRLASVSRMEVTEFMHAACEELAPVLAPLSLNPPSLSATDAEVGVPMRFHGSSTWIVEELREPTKQEQTAAMVEAKSRIAISDRAEG